MRFSAIALAVLAAAGAVSAAQCGERAIDTAACKYSSLLEVREAVDAGSPAKMIIGMLDGVVNRLTNARDNAEASFKQADAYCKDRVAALSENAGDAREHLKDVEAGMGAAVVAQEKAQEEVERLEKALKQHADALRDADAVLATTKEENAERTREYRAARVEMEASLASLRAMLHHVSRQPFGAQGVTGATGVGANVVAERDTDALSPREVRLLRDPEGSLPSHVRDALRLAHAVTDAKEAGATGGAVMDAVRASMTSATTSDTLPDDPAGLRAMHLGLTEEGCVDGVSKWCAALNRCIVVTLNEVCPSKYGPEDADAAAERAMQAFVEVGHRVVSQRTGTQAGAATASRLRALLQRTDAGSASGGDDAVLDAVLAAPAFSNQMFADSAAALGNAEEMTKLLREMIGHVEDALQRDALGEQDAGVAAEKALQKLNKAAAEHRGKHAEIAEALRSARGRLSLAEGQLAHARAGTSSGSAVAGHVGTALETTQASCARHTEQFAAHARAIEAELNMAVLIRRLIKQQFTALLFKTQAHYDVEEAAAIEGKKSGLEEAKEDVKAATEELETAEHDAFAMAATAGAPEDAAEAKELAGASAALSDASEAFAKTASATGLRGRVSADVVAEVASLEAELDSAMHGDWAPAPTGVEAEAEAELEAAHGSAGQATHAKPSPLGNLRAETTKSVEAILEAGGVTGGADTLAEKIVGETEEKAVLSFDL